MAEIDGGRIVARQLKAAGIDTVFGVVAGPMIELFAGAQEEGLRVIGCRHEMNAGFMASAWGWLKQRPGVAIGGSGPGTTNYFFFSSRASLRSRNSVIRRRWSSVSKSMP